MNLPPLRIVLQPSRYLLALLIAVHGLAGAALWLADLRWGWRLAGVAGLLASAVLYGIRRAPCDAVEIDDQGSWRVARQGRWHEASLIEAYVSPLLTVIRLRREDGKRLALTLLPDSLAQDDFRRLRVILKWAGRTRRDTPAPDVD
jgi:hypothetical protein